MPINPYANRYRMNETTDPAKTRATGKVAQGSTTKARFESLIEQECRKLGLDPSLGKAVAMAESGMRQGVRSSAGAIGVMQLMPGTAEELGVNPNIAEENIRGGLTYLKRMLEEFDGKPDLALAAYNAGPGNVRRHGGIPPFAETQSYVEKVLSLAGESIQKGDGLEAVGTDDGIPQDMTPEEAAQIALRLLAQTRYKAISLLSGSDEEDSF